MMKILYFYLSGLLLLWSSCQRPTMLDFALRYAGENRVELEKVLDHYRNDSLKYRAAVFLIGNMPYHYFYTGAQLVSLRQGYRVDATDRTKCQSGQTQIVEDFRRA